jgi:hypothetical protein
VIAHNVSGKQLKEQRKRLSGNFNIPEPPSLKAKAGRSNYRGCTNLINNLATFIASVILLAEEQWKQLRGMIVIKSFIS